MFHGNASNPVWKLPKFHEWAEKGYGFILTEYRGYGGNPGLPSERGFYQDGDAYITWLENQPELKGHSIIVYGESIGSGVAVDVAVHHKISALVLEVTFSSLSEVAAWQYPYIIFADRIMQSKFANADKIKNVKAPILFLLAGQDEVVGTQFGKKLADLANEPKEVHVFEGAHHNNVYEFGAADALRSFLEKYFP